MAHSSKGPQPGPHPVTGPPWPHRAPRCPIRAVAHLDCLSLGRLGLGLPCLVTVAAMAAVATSLTLLQMIQMIRLQVQTVQVQTAQAAMQQCNIGRSPSCT